MCIHIHIPIYTYIYTYTYTYTCTYTRAPVFRSITQSYTSLHAVSCSRPTPQTRSPILHVVAYVLPDPDPQTHAVPGSVRNFPGKLGHPILDPIYPTGWA